MRILRIAAPARPLGSAELMKALLWPLLDNKFLKHPGVGVKLMLPIELTRFIEREERDFKATFIQKRQDLRHHRTGKLVRIHESRTTQNTEQRRRDGRAKENRRDQPHSQQQHP